MAPAPAAPPAVHEPQPQDVGPVDFQEDDQHRHETAEVLAGNIADHVIELDDKSHRTESASADERREAVASLMPHGDGLDSLVDVLDSDPDPAVREAAVRRLAIGGTFGSTRALLDALDDADENVVFRAMEGLVGSGDRSVVREVETALWDHPNQHVRERARNIAQAFDPSSQMDLDRE